MKKDEEKSDKGGGRLLFLLAIAAIVALGGVVFWLHRQREEAATDLDRAKEDYEGLRKLKDDVATIQQRIGPGKKIASPPDRPEDLVGWFNQKAGTAGIPKIGVRSERDNPWTGWREYPYVVEAGGRESTVARSSLVAFLDGVEKERPYLKTKSLKVTFGEQDVVTAVATISFFKSEGAK